MKVFLALFLMVAVFAQQPKVEVAATVAFTEGPTVDAEGHVYFTDVRNHRIMKLSVGGSPRSVRIATLLTG
jgi:sugar lactone lactonase YvrE